jgi:hypothetical protein
MKANGKNIVAGQRFQLSELGAQRCPKFTATVGTIVTVRKNTASITVKLDGNKQTTTLHRDYEPT